MTMRTLDSLRLGTVVIGCGLTLSGCGGTTNDDAVPVPSTSGSVPAVSPAPTTGVTPPVAPTGSTQMPTPVNPPPTGSPTGNPPVGATSSPVAPPAGTTGIVTPIVPTVSPTTDMSTGSPSTSGPASSSTDVGTTSSVDPGTSSDEPTTTGETPTGGNGSVLLSEDFEDDASGAVPQGYDTFIGWVANPASPSGSEIVAVGDGQKHGGAQALQVKGGSNPAQLVWKIPEGQDKLYVRSWIYLVDRQLGQNPGANHETLIALRDSVGQANSEIRFGEIKGIIGTNEVPTDDISPKQDQWGMGPVIEKGRWVCLEVAFLGDLPYHELRAWADGEVVHEVTAADQWNNRSLTSPTWMQGRFVELVFGWHSFSSASNTVWFDDIIVSTERVGCD